MIEFAEKEANFEYTQSSNPKQTSVNPNSDLTFIRFLLNKLFYTDRDFVQDE